MTAWLNSSMNSGFNQESVPEQQIPGVGAQVLNYLSEASKGFKKLLQSCSTGCISISFLRKYSKSDILKTSNFSIIMCFFKYIITYHLILFYVGISIKGCYAEQPQSSYISNLKFTIYSISLPSIFYYLSSNEFLSWNIPLFQISPSTLRKLDIQNIV